MLSVVMAARDCRDDGRRRRRLDRVRLRAAPPPPPHNAAPHSTRTIVEKITICIIQRDHRGRQHRRRGRRAPPDPRPVGGSPVAAPSPHQGRKEKRPPVMPIPPHSWILTRRTSPSSFFGAALVLISALMTSIMLFTVNTKSFLKFRHGIIARYHQYWE